MSILKKKILTTEWFRKAFAKGDGMQTYTTEFGMFYLSPVVTVLFSTIYRYYIINCAHFP